MVTATRRSESLSKVPASVAAYSQAKMDAQGIRSIGDIARLTPDVQFNATSGVTSGQSNNIAIRGISSTVGAATTGVYIDDTPIQVRNLLNAAGTAYPQIFDLDRVEVLRGPQGTLFGAGSEGGAVRGPTVLLTAGNHGDEYEGQIVLSEMIRELDVGEIQGRIIVLPAMNLPAAIAGTRVSPIDGANLHRSFPGDPDGGPTSQIAHYVNSVLFPIAQIHHDLHAGGSSLDYLPFASMRLGPDQALNARSLAALLAFGAPWGMVWNFTTDQRLASTAAAKHGLLSLGGEFGSGGSVSVSGVRVVQDGVRRLLAHASVIDPQKAPPMTETTRLVEVKSRDYYSYAEEAGLFEPFSELGAEVRAGQKSGQVHFVNNPGREPVPSFFKADGIVICKRHFGRVERGDCAFISPQIGSGKAGVWRFIAPGWSSSSDWRSG